MSVSAHQWMQYIADKRLAFCLLCAVSMFHSAMKYCANLRVLYRFQQNEQKEGKFRAVACSYYWIDYRMFTNVVKWHIAVMRKDIDSKLRQQLEQRGYKCPRCQRVYETIQADMLLDMSTGIMRCVDCKTEEVEDHNESDGVMGSHDRMERFNSQMAPVTEALKNVQAMGPLPAFDIRKHISEHFFSSGNAGGSRTAEFQVVIDDEPNEDLARRQREEQAAQKRQQNVLPSWHLKSTVSGDLTALGHQEHVKAQENFGGPKAATSLPSTSGSSNSQLLRSLGPVSLGSASHGDAIVVIKDEEVARPVATAASSLARQFYAQFSSSSDADESKFANSKKRPREESLFLPTPRTTTTVVSRHSSTANSSTGSPPALSQGSGSALSFGGPESPSDAPMDGGLTVLVAGKQVALTAVTEDMQGQMSEEEYMAYCDVLAESGLEL